MIMPVEFYVRDRLYENTIHRLVFDPHNKSVRIVDHDPEDLEYEISMMEFGEPPQSTCALLRDRLLKTNINEAFMSMEVYPCPIMIRAAVDWALPYAKRFDRNIEHNLKFHNGRPMTAVGTLGLVLKFLKKYTKPGYHIPDDYCEECKKEDDIEDITLPEMLKLYDYLNEKDSESFHLVSGLIDLVQAVGWWPPIGVGAAYSDEVYSKVIEAVDGIMITRDVYFTKLRDAAKSRKDKVDIDVRRSMTYWAMVAGAAHVTRKHKKEL